MKFYNTLTRTKEEFKPIVGNKVGVYSCGPTVYWNQHIGNMYAFLNWDILVRTLRYLGNDVNWVMNITDVGHLTSDQDTGEDKMEKGAKRECLTVWEIARKYEEQFKNSLDLLNIKKPDVMPRATEHIKEQIELAEKMEENGFTYKTKTGLVFDTSKFGDYAKFANLKLKEMNVGARVDVDKEKRNPWDFLLWVTNQSKHIMQWDSPWGRGFPGWHLECTAMSTKYLGKEFDIHTGGIEHIGVHHTNEIAQAYGAFRHNTARFWIHNAWLQTKEGKMSKSLGNVYTVQNLKEMGYDPLAFRYLVLMSHYRKGITFSLDSLEAAQNGLNKLRNLLNFPSLSNGKVNIDYKKLFIEEISDDLSMSEVMALIWNLMRDNRVNNEDKRATILDFDRVLGLGLEASNAVLEEIPEEIKKLAAERQKARENKNWAESDRLRDLIKEKGYLVEDLKNDCKIRKVVIT